MSDLDSNRVLDYLREQRRPMVELLGRLALVESPSGERDALDRVLTILAAELKHSGMSVRRLTSGGMLYARPLKQPAREPFQLLVGHCDTVWPIGTVVSMPVRVEGEALRGPGVFDMKAGLVQMIYALRAVSELRLRVPADPVVLVNSDEETGSHDSTPFICSLARRAARAFVLEPAFGKSGKLKTARKAVGSFNLTIKGRAAHAGINPEEGASAVLELSHQIQRLFALNDAARGITVNVGTIDGGIRSNVVAAEVHASIDVRVRTLADAEEIESAIYGLSPVNAGTKLQVNGGFEHPPMEPTERNQALWRVVQEIGYQLGLELEEAAVGGASDGNTTSQHTATLDGLGAVGDGAHSSHEYVDLAAMVERSALLALLLLAPISAPSRYGQGPVTDQHQRPGEK